MVTTTDRYEKLMDIVSNPDDPVVFYQAVNELGGHDFTEEDPLNDIYLEGWRNSQDSLPFRLPAPGKKMKRPTDRAMRLYDLVQDRGIDVSSVGSNTSDKRQLLLDAGYRSLNGQGSERVTIDSAKPTRVEKVVYDTYHRVDRYHKQNE